jgi:hypothetical protein
VLKRLFKHRLLTLCLWIALNNHLYVAANRVAVRIHSRAAD